MRFTPENRSCLHCSTVFRVTRKSQTDKKYCGSACYRAYEAIHGRPSDIQLIEFSCAKCGKPFHKQPGELAAYRKAHGKDPLYCSRACGWEGKRKLFGQPCVMCGNPVPVAWTEGKEGRTPRTTGRRNKLCSSECRKAFKLAEHERLRPLEERQVSVQITKQGYVRLRFPNKHGVKGREVLEHRYVMEQALGRELRPEETVHHKNGQRDCNTLDNLDLRSGNHGPGGDVPAMIRWAHEFIALYPQVDREGNFTPVVRPREDH